MLAKILGVLLLIGGVVWGFKLIWPLFGSLFGRDLAGILGRVELGDRLLRCRVFAAKSCFDAGDALRGLEVGGQRRV